jgi:cell division protease FtsH
MGGRAAEEVVYGTLTTGAESDVQLATHLARQMVTRWGMSQRLGPVSLAPRENPFLPGVDELDSRRPYSETTATLVDAEVQQILQQAHDSGMQLLQHHRPALDALAAALLERETLEEDDILRVTGLQHAPRLESLPRPAPAAANGTR